MRQKRNETLHHIISDEREIHSFSIRQNHCVHTVAVVTVSLVPHALNL